MALRAPRRGGRVAGLAAAAPTEDTIALAPDATPLVDWIGRTESADDVATVAPLRALAATLDRDDAPAGDGEPIPPGWHWLYFLPVPRSSALDGGIAMDARATLA
jgi:hydroxyacyl-ACP dehydratase HTD2-like protein with hotdog domain